MLKQLVEIYEGFFVAKDAIISVEDATDFWGEKTGGCTVTYNDGTTSRYATKAGRRGPCSGIREQIDKLNQEEKEFYQNLPKIG